MKLSMKRVQIDSMAHTSGFFMSNRNQIGNRTSDIKQNEAFGKVDGDHNLFTASYSNLKDEDFLDHYTELKGHESKP